MLFRIFSVSSSVVGRAGMRQRPRWHPEGDVEVVSFHRRNPCATSSGDKYVSISGSCSRLAMCRRISIANGLEFLNSSGI
jgi:hypothetical protein